MVVQGKHLTRAAVVAIVSVVGGLGSIYRFLALSVLEKIEQERVEVQEWRHNVKLRLTLLENPTLTDDQRAALKAALKERQITP